MHAVETQLDLAREPKPRRDLRGFDVLSARTRLPSVDSRLRSPRLRRLFAAASLLIVGMGSRAVHAEQVARLEAVFPGLAPQLEAWAAAEAPVEAEPAEPAEPEVDFPFLPGDDEKASVSIGDTSHGRLVNGQRLEESEALGILPRQQKRNLRYGTEGLIRAIDRAAKALHDATGTKLWVGNLGKERGGDIQWSVSHNSGRDADIAFCYQDAKGKPVDPPDLVRLNKDGLAKGFHFRFDAARTWKVIEALITTPEVQVQYLFMSNPLRGLVLKYAADHGASSALIQKAAEVVRQPGAAAAHDDHLHLRIFCEARDVEGGCLNTGTIHPRIDTFAAEHRAAQARAAGLIASADPAVRAAAITRLVLLRTNDQTGAIASRLSDDDARVRAASATALGDLRATDHGIGLVHRFRVEPELEVKLAILEAVGNLGGKGSGRFLAQVVGSPQLDHWTLLPPLGQAAVGSGPILSILPGAFTASRQLADQKVPAWWAQFIAEDPDPGAVLQRAALGAMTTAERLEPVEAAIALLRDRDPEVRMLAARALRHTTNLSYRVDWAEDDGLERERGLQRWQAALAKSPKASRRDWLVIGFRAAGYEIPALRQQHGWEILRAIASEDHTSFNAQRTMMRLFDHEPPSLSWPKNDACLYWLRWLKGRRTRFKLERPPNKTIQACHRKVP